MSEWKETTFGIIPSDWDVKSFKDVLKIKGRIGWKGYKTSDLRESGPVVIGGVNIKSNINLDYSKLTHLSNEKYEESPEIILIKGDVILVTRGNGIGDVGRYDGKFQEATINPSVVILTNYKGDSKFLYYFLASKQGREQILSLEGGSSIPALYQGLLKNLNLPFPKIEIQKSIASFLSGIDDKIDLLHRQNTTLEAMAETLFRQWFVEEAKEDWEAGKLPDEFSCIMGASPPGESYTEVGIGISMFQGNADFEFRFPKKRVYTTDPKRFAEKYDTLISVRAPVGEQNMASERCCIGRGVAAFRYKASNEFYSYTYFKMKSIMEEIKQFNETGTVFGSISKSDFENLNIIIPDKATVMKFQKEVKPIDDKIISNCTQIRTLTTLRDTLLPKLMSGEVRVEV